MPTSAKLVGINGKMFVGAAGTTPTVAINDEQEVGLKIDNDTVTWATRGGPRADSGYGKQSLSASAKIVKDNTNTSFGLLAAACVGRTAIAIKFLDKASGAGWDADWIVGMSDEKQGMDGVITVDFDFKQSLALRDATIT